MSPSPGSQAGEEAAWRKGGRADSRSATAPTTTVPRCRMTVAPPFDLEVVGEVQLDASGQHGRAFRYGRPHPLAGGVEPRSGLGPVSISLIPPSDESTPVASNGR